LVSAILDGLFQGNTPRVAQPLAFDALIAQPLFLPSFSLSHLHKRVALAFDLTVLIILEELLIIWVLICSLHLLNSLIIFDLQLLLIISDDFLLPFLYLCPYSLFIKGDLLESLLVKPGILHLLFLLVSSASTLSYDLFLYFHLDFHRKEEKDLATAFEVF
jgi:hypothetical protein